MRKIKRLAAIFLAVLMLVSIVPVQAQAAGSKLIALTFDDGPSSKNTARLLDGLKARGVHCTFFMVGTMSEANPQLVKRAWEEGHEIASHTYDHPTLTSLSDQQIKQQLSKNDGILDKAIGIDFGYMLRPPYGDYNSRVLAAANVPCFYWSMDTYDWKTQNADSVYNEFIKQARDGSIALLHDSHSTSVTAALRAIDTLQAQGYEFVTLSEMFMRRGVALQNGKIYFSCYPGSYGTDPAVKKPVITYGDTSQGTLVSISGDSRGQVYYTLNGELPTPRNSIKYTGPFLVTKDTTVKAVTVIKWNGIRTDSVEKFVKYTPTAAAPLMTVSDGKLTIASNIPGAEIYYTADGSVPTRGSARYGGAIALEPDTTYRARVYAPGYLPGVVAMLTYTSRGNVFTDVAVGAWCYDAVDRAVSEGIFKGVTATEFSPDTPLTRAMLVTVLYRMAGEPDVNGLKADFTDVPDDYWCYDALAWAANSGIINGYADRSFRPRNGISRQALSAMIYRYIGYSGKVLSATDDVLGGFSDNSDIDPVLYEAVNALCSAGIVRGYQDNTMRPVQGASRAQAATILLRMEDLLPTLPDAENSENTENTESSENTENTENSENTENTENSENTENTENTEI